MKRLLSLLVAACTVAVIGSSGSQASALSYTALGDSVAAGAGLSGSSTAVCGRSPQAYPHIVARELGVRATHLACNGAKVDEGIYGPQWRNGERITPQLEAAFIDGTPDVVTMTIGANDIRWRGIMRACYQFNCGGRAYDAQMKVLRADYRIELFASLYKINRMSGGEPPQVLVNGYYRPFSSRACDEARNFTLTERRWVNKQVNELNGAIRSVVRYFDFAEYVPVSFAGHELCSSDTWVQTADDLYPFHPTARGQQAIAEANLRRIDR